ncbi:type II secretion system protein [Candidatus Methylomirabilis sp.]|uniref:PilW family protein n=1 Tax=Candidatus Methylomirabilis sp. TaxID=2032687 RepID=UPI003076231D
MIMLKRGSQPGYTLVELLVTMAILGLVASAVAGVYQVSQQTYTRASSLEAAQVGARAGLDRMANELRLIGSYWVGADDAGNAITAATSTSITFMANVDNVGALSVSNGTEVKVSTTASGTSVPLSISASDTADAFKVYTGSGSALNDWIYIANAGMREVKQIESISGSTLTLASALRSPYPVPPDTNVQNVLVRDIKTITYARNATATSTCPALTCLTRKQGGDNADPIVSNVSGLTFTYYGTTGSRLPLGQDQNPPPCPAPGPNPDPNLIREIRIDLKVRGADGSPRCMITRVRPRSLPW